MHSCTPEWFNIWHDVSQPKEGRCTIIKQTYMNAHIPAISTNATRKKVSESPPFNTVATLLSLSSVTQNETPSPIQETQQQKYRFRFL